MSGELEGAAELATGGLIARAFEPRAGEGAGEGDAMCLNCGTALLGTHCHRCGQAAHVHRSFGAIGHELLHGVVHFEGKMWRTLPMLAFRPGELTRRYVAGERARFVSPMAMFLFSVFTLFALLSILGVSPPTEISSGAQVEAGIAETRSDLADDREEAVEDRDRLAPGDPQRAKLDARIADIDREAAVLAAAATAVKGKGSTVTDIGKTGWHRLDKGIEKANRNPGLLLYKLQANSYKFSWLLIPLSLPFVWLLFAWKRQYRLYDHAVFVTYSIAFMSLVFVTLMLLDMIPGAMPLIGTLALIVPPLHLYKQLRGAYALRRWSALARTLVLGSLIGVVLTMFIIALLALGLVG
ncbi:DUF3667 domain-containing protein [Sphingomonas japonica]|uniref:DUF3667 domain-containing protein n=1 Tax=Sphingomonas japonica TaxID=511662 RepID=A0ABX0TYF3_9SPHN|nr:DUF3667 domain-containing protein [Sphingomonas japonica]NIJ23340.1 hypothetical protein [Sphingomonas japonica]